ncbi:MAG: accessory gene regulator B family protein [Ruminococcus sp.]|nr:accessory gene regulator B family protein [Ruminococcus sp.]
MDKIMDFIVGVVDKNSGMDSEEREVVRYGLELILLKALFGCLIAVTGILMGCFWECVLYNLMFLALRSYAGGYHAQTRTRCLIQSMLTVIAALTAIRLCCENDFAAAVLAGLSLVCGFALWKLAPVDTENRQLDENEAIMFGKKTRITLAVYLAAAVIAYILGAEIVSCSAMAAVSVSGILVMAEYRKKTRRTSE